MLVDEQIVDPSSPVPCYPPHERSTGEIARKWLQFSHLYYGSFSGTPYEMSGNNQLATCTRCGGRIEPFGRMRHHFVDAEFQPICVGCARELVPERVAEAEEMDRRWGPDHNNKS